MYNHRIQGRRREPSEEPHQQHNTDKESPFLLYTGLKVFSATRSKEIIDILHAHGLCVSYGRILRVTQGLGEALLQLFYDKEAVIHELLQTGLFTVGAKDILARTLIALSLSLTIREQVYHCSNFHRALMTDLKGTTSNLLRFLPQEVKK